MKFYTIITNGLVGELIPEIITVDIPTWGDEFEKRDIPIAERYHPDFIAQLVEVDPDNLPTPPALTPPPVTSISKRQAALALFDAGKLEAVQATIAQNPRAAVEWEASAVIERQSTLVLQLGAALNLDLDALFAAAAQL